MKMFLPGEHGYQVHLWMLFNELGRKDTNQTVPGTAGKAPQPKQERQEERRWSVQGWVVKACTRRHELILISVWRLVVTEQQVLSSCIDTSSTPCGEFTPRTTQVHLMPCFGLKACFHIVCSPTGLKPTPGNTSCPSLIHSSIRHFLPSLFI